MIGARPDEQIRYPVSEVAAPSSREIFLAHIEKELQCQRKRTPASLRGVALWGTG
jgi:hypothetical protein